MIYFIESFTPVSIDGLLTISNMHWISTVNLPFLLECQEKFKGVINKSHEKEIKDLLYSGLLKTQPSILNTKNKGLTFYQTKVTSTEKSKLLLQNTIIIPFYRFIQSH